MIDFIVSIFIVLFAVSVVIVARVIINKRKRLCELKKEEEKKAQEEQKKRCQEENPLRELEEAKDSKEKADIKQLEPEEKELEVESEEIKQEEQEEWPEPVKTTPPNKRGGRPRGNTEQGSSSETSPEERPRHLKPEIICWNKNRNWIVCIEVPEEIVSPRVTQNDELLEQDTSDNTRYHLKYLEGKVKVSWNNGEQEKEIRIPVTEEGRNYLVFKMRKDWHGLGRLVKYPTTGYYLIIVPEEWQRDEKASGSAPVVPENVQVNGYKAHFFVLRQKKDTDIAFINAKGERIQLKTGSSRFQLVGKEISDHSEDMGPLFGIEPPCIKADDKSVWNNVGAIVSGEEGSGRNRWRTQFVPQEDVAEQRMPNELTNRRGGWYFVRIYDKNGDLVESMDFRFVAGLKDIQIKNSECLPTSNGYNDVTVQFFHQANCEVELADKEKLPDLKIYREDNLTVVTLPPKPDYDESHWIFRDGNASVEATVLIERVWWNIGSVKSVSESWTDKISSSSREEFTAITDKALWVKFPRERWVNKIHVGFNPDRNREYNVGVEQKEIAVPFRDFCDAEEIGNKQAECVMKIWVSPEKTRACEAPVLKIPVELPPVEFKPQSVGHSILEDKKYSKIKAIIKCPGRYHLKKHRQGKGFSRREIEGAGLTMDKVKRLRILYDKRRKSSHSWNIEKLKSIIGSNRHGSD